ncbi:MAG: glycosyltransferase [Acidobacteria bacterium]|nr:glycosyltransferase [Acidobacteriota bacterium]
MSDRILSVVIPVHNEESHLLPLYDRLTSVLEATGDVYEIVFIDDCSTDSSRELLAHLVEHDNRLRAVLLRRNFGQTAALAAGFELADGDVIIAMDGDLQHAPEDIPALLAKIDEGYDVASGWRHERIDNWLTRRLPSRIANWLMAKASGIELHDFGTTFKAYNADVLKSVRLYGELHRFIPVLASIEGARIAEVPIQNLPRRDGRSHYGLSRTFRVLFDLITLRFLLKYLTRPMHFFGSIGLALGGAGGVGLAFLAIQKLRGVHIMVEHGPLLIATAILVLGGIQMVCTGLIGEVLMRTYFESQGRTIYSVREILSSKDREAAV